MEITLTEAKAKLSAMVEKAMAGEEIIVTKMGKPAVKLVPYVTLHSKPSLLGLMQGEGSMNGDFHEWPEDIARALHIID